MSKGRRKSRKANRLDELVDIGDSGCQGLLELVERALDDGAVAVGAVALGFGSLNIDLTSGGGGSEVVSVTRAGGTGPATAGEVALDARVLLDGPVFRALGVLPLLGLGLGRSIALDGLVEGLVGGQDGVALATWGETLVVEDLGVVLENEVKTTLHLVAGHAAVAAETLVVLRGFGFSVGVAGLVAGHAGVATQSLARLDGGLGVGISVTREDGIGGAGEGVLDGAERRAGLVAGHAGVATQSLASGLGEREGVGDGHGCTLGLVAGHAWVAAEALAKGRRLGISEGAGREGKDGEDSAGDLHDDGARLVVVVFWGEESEEAVVL